MKTITKLEDFCDMQELQAIMKNWAAATHTGIILFDPENTLKLGPYGFPEYCFMVVKNEQGAKYCRQNADRKANYLCCHAGLNEYRLELELPDGTNLGHLIFGQVVTPLSSPPDFWDISCRCNTDATIKQLQNAYTKIKEKNKAELDASLALLQSIIKTFIEKSYRKYLLHQERSTDHTLSELTQQLYGYNITVNLTNMQYKLISGSNMEQFVHLLANFTDYVELNRKLSNMLPRQSKEKINTLIGIPALQKRVGLTGYIGQVVYESTFNNSKSWHEARLFMGFNEKGDPIANILGRDVTEEHLQADAKAQLKIERAANAAKSRFLSAMSHDIRTPLNGIMGLLAIAQTHRADQAKVDECLAKIDISSHHLLNLINDILDLNKLLSGKMNFVEEPVDILQLIKEVGIIVNPLALQAKIEFTRPEITLTHTHFLCSPLHLRQIIINILTNAIKYNRPEGGYVHTTITETHSDETYAYINCTVKDNGIGMSEAFQQHMFKPFEQESTQARSENKGSGLGLAIVKQLIDQLGGTLEVTSQVNVGTCFSFTLPYRINKHYQEQAAEEQTEPENTDIAGARVLLVEDNELNMEIAQQLLEDAGAVITAATDGEQAVHTFSDNPPASFDIILMDIQMPKMDGLTATRTIRALPRPDAASVPIYAMTANAFADDIANAKAAGMNGHLAKPLDVPKILATIAKHYKK